jgi:hypothetical protein
MIHGTKIYLEDVFKIFYTFSTLKGIRWGDHGSPLERKGMYIGYWWRGQETGVGGRIILRWRGDRVGWYGQD